MREKTVKNLLGKFSVKQIGKYFNQFYARMPSEKLVTSLLNLMQQFLASFCLNCKFSLQPLYPKAAISASQLRFKITI